MYQSVLPFDEEFAWVHLVQNLKKLDQAGKVVFYGLRGRKVTIRKIDKDKYLVTAYSLNAVKFNIEQEGNLKFLEVEFMSTVLKPITKHVHFFEKSATHNEDWRNQIYRCKDPHCKYRSAAQYIEGKEARCFKCKCPIVVPIAQLWKKNKRIVCLTCSKSPKRFKLAAAKEVFADIFNEVDEPIEAPDSILDALRKERNEAN